MRTSPSRRPQHNRFEAAIAAAVLVVPVVLLGFAQAAPAAAVAAPRAAVLHVGVVSRQDAPVRPGSEPDTVVEPDVAVSPVNRNIAVEASHDGRYPDGGAVGISYAWTHDGGATWQHRYLPGLTVSTGGSTEWARVSDPVVAFGPDGDAYVSTLLIGETCSSAVAVSRSTDGGRTFAAPVLAHYSASCDVSDDKNTLVVDTSPSSRHRGRLYQFWTPFLTDMFGNYDGSPQAMVYSDDHGATWSRPVNVSPPHANTQNSTPMLKPNGTVVDAYIDYGDEEQHNEDTEFRDQDAVRRAQPAGYARAAATYPLIRTAISTDGGQFWQDGGIVTQDVGEGPSGIRCCLSSATADPRTGRLFVAWTSTTLSRVKVASSSDGVHWGSGVVADTNAAGRNAVNVDVAAYNGVVAVSYGLTNTDTKRGRFAQQYVVSSHTNGRRFPHPIAVGPRSNYHYAARARGIFPGDYIGTALSHGRLYAVWCVSAKPPTPGARYHQVVYGATLTA